MTIYGALDVGRRSKYLFQAEFADLALVTRTGHVPTFTRADATTCAQLVDSNGVYSAVLPGVPRIIGVDTDGDGVPDSSAALLEATATQLIQQATALATSPWSTTGTTPTNSVGTFAGLSFCRCANANSSKTSQAITFTGNGVKAVAIALKFDGSTGTTFFSIHDSTTPADVLVGRATWAADGTATFATTTGTMVTPNGVRLANGAYLVLALTTSVTASHSFVGFANNGIDFSGSATSVLVSAMTVTDTPAPVTPLLRGSSAVVRNTDALSYSFTPAPQSMTWYVKFVEQGTILTGATTGLIGIGASTNAALFIQNNGSGLYQALLRGASDVTSTLAAAPTYGQLVELRLTLTIDANQKATVQLAQSIAGAGETVASVSSSIVAPAAWHDTTLTLNDRGAGVSPGFVAMLSARIAAGVQALPAMRATS